jgi:hypothetical protein
MDRKGADPEGDDDEDLVADLENSGSRMKWP